MSSGGKMAVEQAAAETINTGLIGSVIALFTFAVGLILGNRNKASTSDLNDEKEKRDDLIRTEKEAREKDKENHRLECPVNQNVLTSSRHDNDCDRRLFPIIKEIGELKQDVRDGTKSQQQGFNRLHERLDDFKKEHDEKVTMKELRDLFASLKSQA